MQNKTKTLLIILLIASLTFTPIVVLGVVFINNTDIDYEFFSINYKEDAESEIKIAHLSDLHFPKIKIDIEAMIDRLKAFELDFIAITGDLIDAKAEFHRCGVKKFIAELSKAAPIYYVNGNHEMANNESEALYDYLRQKEVKVLNNENSILTKGSLKISVIGISDNKNYNYEDYFETVKPDYRILLAHRPERERNITYVSCPDREMRWKIPNLVLCGHAHGGQFRINNHGIVAPNQGIFPKYDNGRYDLTDYTSMIVSRGIGNSIIPFRFNNHPHVPIISIKL